MPLEQQLNDYLKQAMKDRDQPSADALRMLKTKIMERRTAAGFSGTIDDTLVQDVIGAYRKTLAKALDEYVAAGDRGKEQAESLRFEMTVCDRFLPRRLDEAATRALVKERIAALGITDPKQAGKVVGDINKTHKDQIDGREVKRIADEELAQKA